MHGWTQFPATFRRRSGAQRMWIFSRGDWRPRRCSNRRRSVSEIARLAPASFDYAILRVVPRVEREEFINAGVVVLCLEKRYLDARILLNEERLRALWPEADVELVRQHLDAIPRICIGDESAGPIAKLSQRERFHWLTSPRSTIIQPSPVHTGVCEDTTGILERLATQFLTG